jgi:hypothetical protein
MKKTAKRGDGGGAGSFSPFAALVRRVLLGLQEQSEDPQVELWIDALVIRHELGIGAGRRSPAQIWMR